MGPLTAMSEAYSVSSAAMYEDRVTFQRSTSTKGSDGGDLAPVPVDTTAGVPCRYRPATGKESEVSGKTVSGTTYMIFVPSSFADALVDVDAKCQAVMAARDGGEVSRTFNVVAPLRYMGIEIECLVTIEA